ncbi:unnamed protein product [Arabis nemorensis]|uniref:Uncharacterized protein n=1 Tax=Arabis nemorensis TaxID=586526 RepID=A0A565BTT0_9BRAS|nr:unnamed protein product [Arabis nemorensis]
MIQNEYTELMDMVDELYLPIFTKINKMFSEELEVIRNHHSFETLKFMPKTPRISFEEGIQMLKI